LINGSPVSPSAAGPEKATCCFGSDLTDEPENTAVNAVLLLHGACDENGFGAD